MNSSVERAAYAEESAKQRGQERAQLESEIRRLEGEIDAAKASIAQSEQIMRDQPEIASTPGIDDARKLSANALAAKEEDLDRARKRLRELDR